MKQGRSGFTLVEVLVVIVIVGVLAGIAMPQLFRNVERSRATEALESIGVIKRAIEICAMKFNNDYSFCQDYNTISMSDPSYNASTHAAAHFAYTFTAAASSFQVVATRNTIDSGTAGDTVTLSRISSGAIARSGTTAFSGIQ